MSSTRYVALMLVFLVALSLIPVLATSYASSSFIREYRTVLDPPRPVTAVEADLVFRITPLGSPKTPTQLFHDYIEAKSEV